jgi:N-acetylmuramic acid 6-phosphate etherase
MSLADALELPQTYGIPLERIVLILADAPALPHRLDGGREDKGSEARAEVRQHGIGPGDCVIATSASGTTPFTVEGVEEAKARGAAIISLAGNPGAPLLALADVPILLLTGAEVISGSTRMGAGTAQKAALNMLSTLIGVRLGHVHDGLMVNVLADNHKLRGRAARIIVQITGVAMDAAQAALEQTQGVVKPAILLAAGARDKATADEILMHSRGNVRQALAMLAERRKAVND